MIRTALALTIAAIATGAAAQSTAPILPSKVIEITPSGTGCSGWNCGPPQLITGNSQPTSPAAQAAKRAEQAKQEAAYQPSPADSPLINGCKFEAVGRLPIVAGAQVVSTTAKFDKSDHSYWSPVEWWDIFVTVDFNGSPVHYTYFCRVRPGPGGGAELIR